MWLIIEKFCYSSCVSSIAFFYLFSVFHSLIRHLVRFAPISDGFSTSRELVFPTVFCNSWRRRWWWWWRRTFHFVSQRWTIWRYLTTFWFFRNTYYYYYRRCVNYLKRLANYCLGEQLLVTGEIEEKPKSAAIILNTKRQSCCNINKLAGFFLLKTTVYYYYYYNYLLLLLLCKYILWNSLLSPDTHTHTGRARHYVYFWEVDIINVSRERDCAAVVHLLIS